MFLQVFQTKNGKRERGEQNVDQLALALAKFRRDKHNGDFDLGAEPPHFSLVFAGFSLFVL